MVLQIELVTEAILKPLSRLERLFRQVLTQCYRCCPAGQEPAAPASEPFFGLIRSMQMRFFFAFLLGIAALSTARAQLAQPVADLRSLLQQNWAASAQAEQSAADSTQWQLSPEEQARLRQQLADFSNKKTLVQDEPAESRTENQEPSPP